MNYICLVDKILKQEHLTPARLSITGTYAYKREHNAWFCVVIQNDKKVWTQVHKASVPQHMIKTVLHLIEQA